MSIKLNYKKLYITWNNWNDVPKIYNLIREMRNYNFKWCDASWDSYLNDYENLGISVSHSEKLSTHKLLFDTFHDMDLFILHFILTMECYDNVNLP